MTWRVVEAPAKAPVNLQEAKEHLRVDMDDDDLLIASLISTASTHVEQVLERALMPQKWELALDDFPIRRAPQAIVHLPIVLPGGVVTELLNIKYFDSTGVEQTLDAAFYTLDQHSEPARVGLKQGKSWPATAQQINAVKALYSVGYASAAVVPAPIKAAILLLVGELYGNREMSVDSRFSEMPTMKNLLWPYKRIDP